MNDGNSIFVVVSVNDTWVDPGGKTALVTNAPGDLTGAVTLDKYMASQGLQITSSLSDNCRLLAASLNINVVRVYIDPNTRLEDDRRVYEPEKLWTGEPNKPSYESAKDPDETEDETVGWFFEMNGIELLFGGIIVLLILAAVIGSVIN